MQYWTQSGIRLVQAYFVLVLKLIDYELLASTGKQILRCFKSPVFFQLNIVLSYILCHNINAGNLGRDNDQTGIHIQKRHTIQNTLCAISRLTEASRCRIAQHTP
jgi:hypothetical protein